MPPTGMYRNIELKQKNHNCFHSKWCSVCQPNLYSSIVGSSPTFSTGAARVQNICSRQMATTNVGNRRYSVIECIVVSEVDVSRLIEDSLIMYMSGINMTHVLSLYLLSRLRDYKQRRPRGLVRARHNHSCLAYASKASYIYA